MPATLLTLTGCRERLWGPLLSRWLQRSGPLTPEYADALVETALDGLRPRADPQA